jgi:hypothetical protein
LTSSWRIEIPRKCHKPEEIVAKLRHVDALASRIEWGNVAVAPGYWISGRVSGNYRSGYMKAIFPNRLEISMRLEPL